MFYDTDHYVRINCPWIHDINSKLTQLICDSLHNADRTRIHKNSLINVYSHRIETYSEG